MELRIVCAACMSQDGDIVLGVRHHDGIMNDAIATFNSEEAQWSKWQTEFNIQGFIDQQGNFHNRQEAWEIAESAGQIIRRVGGDDANGGTLYSENLY